MTARVQSQCTPSCSRYVSPFSPANTVGVIACAAFPDGIPDKIWNNEVDHRQPVDGDHGLQWLAAPGYTFPEYALQTGDQPTMTAAAEPGAVHTGAMIALVPADPDMFEVGDGEPVDELHCTLLYLGEADQIDEATRAGILDACEAEAAGWPEITAEGFGLAAFNPTGDEPCLVLLLSGDDLTDLHEGVVNIVDTEQEQHQPWIPHITLAYTDDLPMISDLIGLCGPVVFDRLRVVFAGEVTDFPLTGEPDADEDDAFEEDEPIGEVVAAWDAAEKHLTTEPPPTMTAGSARVVWDGCPRCFAPVHEGKCPPGL